MKQLNNEYRIYHSYFSFNEDNIKQNESILEKKIKMEETIIKQHQNINVLLLSILQISILRFNLLYSVL